MHKEIYTKTYACMREPSPCLTNSGLPGHTPKKGIMFTWFTANQKLYASVMMSLSVAFIWSVPISPKQRLALQEEDSYYPSSPKVLHPLRIGATGENDKRQYYQS
jgi:hypothetical protein